MLRSIQARPRRILSKIDVHLIFTMTVSHYYARHERNCDIAAMIATRTLHCTYHDTAQRLCAFMVAV